VRGELETGVYQIPEPLLKGTHTRAEVGLGFDPAHQPYGAPFFDRIEHTLAKALEKELVPLRAVFRHHVGETRCNVENVEAAPRAQHLMQFRVQRNCQVRPFESIREVIERSLCRRIPARLVALHPTVGTAEPRVLRCARTRARLARPNR